MLKTNQKKKVKKREENETRQQFQLKHHQNGNLNFYSEEVSKEIINKILTLTHIQIRTKKTYKKIPSFLIKDLKRKFDLSLQLLYLDQEKDDVQYPTGPIRIKKTSNSYEKNKIKKKNGDIQNSYIMINDNNSVISHFHNYFLRNHFLTNFDKNLNKSKEEKDDNIQDKFNDYNFWDFPSQPKSLAYHRIKTHANKIIPQGKIQTKVNQPEEPIIKSSSKLMPKASIKDKKKVKIFDLPKLKNPIKKIPAMNSIIKLEENLYMIPKESEEIIQLRDQKIEELIRLKDKENFKHLSKLQLEEKKKNDKFNPNNIKFISGEIGTFNQIEKEKKRKYIEFQIRKGNYTLDVQGNVVVLNEVIPDQLEGFPNIVYQQKEINIIPPDNVPEIDMDTVELIENKNNNVNLFGEPEEYVFIKDRVQPSGSNYEIIRPEVGVTIKERKRKKTGGTKFYEKYKKYSINEFNKSLQDLNKEEDPESNKKSYDYSGIEGLKVNNDEIIDDDDIDKEDENENENEMEKLKKIIKESKNRNRINDFLCPFDEYRKQTRGSLSRLKKNRILNKSYSEISLKKRGVLLQNLIMKAYSFKADDVEDDEDKYLEEKKEKCPPLTYRLNQRNIFIKKNDGISRKHNSFIYNVIDSFNKSIVSGNANKKGFENYIYRQEDNSLPIIPSKISKNTFYNDNFDKSTKNLFRTRIKKNI